MIGSLFPSSHDRKLIPQARLTGPMPWVIAVMLFLTLLATAAALALGSAAHPNQRRSGRARHGADRQRRCRRRGNATAGCRSGAAVRPCSRRRDAW